MEEVYITSHNPLVTLCKVVRVVFLPVWLISHSGIHLTKLTLAHILLGDDVDGLETLTIVHTRELGIVAQLVEYLDAIYCLGRQRLDGCVDILAEELLAIDENLLDGLTLRLYRAICDGDTWHLLQESLHIGVIRHLECTCAIAQCVTILRCAQSLGCLDHLLDALGSLLDVDFTERERCTRESKLLGYILVTDECDDHCVLTIREAWDRGETIGSRGVVTLVVGLGSRVYLDYSTWQTELSLLVNNRECDLATLSKCRNSERESEDKNDNTLHYICVFFVCTSLNQSQF